MQSTIQKNQFSIWSLFRFRDSDSEEEGKQSFSLHEKLTSKKFPEYRQYFVKDLKGDEVNLAYFQRLLFQLFMSLVILLNWEG